MLARQHWGVPALRHGAGLFDAIFSDGVSAQPAERDHGCDAGRHGRTHPQHHRPDTGARGLRVPLTHLIIWGLVFVRRNLVLIFRYLRHRGRSHEICLRGAKRATVNALLPALPWSAMAILHSATWHTTKS